MDAYLKHYGIVGMKWGVRRYRNYDGSYTQAGLKRYDKSMAVWESANQKVKDTKKSYKEGKASKLDVNRAKNERKEARRKLNRDYKQLKKDKMGDQGKELYRQGKTIRENKAHKAAYLAGYGASVAGLLTYQIWSSGSDKDLARNTAAAAVGLAAVSRGLKIIGDAEANKLRAYYGHNRPKD